VQPAFATEVSQRLKPGGLWHCASDWVNYAEQMQEVLDAVPLLVRRDDLVAECRGRRPTTRYERLGIDRGHIVTDLVYQRVDPR
jgi:tRNA (guanine-N7-)-methyltransferase